LSNPQRDNDSAELFALTQRLQRLHAVTAPDRLRRTGLQRAFSRQGARDRRSNVISFPWSRGIALAAARLAASIVVGTMLGYGAYAASAASLPDSPLYQVKLLVEDARVAIAPSDQRPQIYVEQAARRIEETDALIQGGRISDAEVAASDAARRLESAQAASREGTVPQATAPEVQRAIGTTTDQYRSVSRALADRGGSSPPVTAARPASEQPVPEARTSPAQSSALEAHAPPAQTAPEPESAETPPIQPAASANGAVGAPLPGTGFAPISAPSVSATPQTRPTSEPGRVSAPPSGFSAIASPTQGPAATAQAAATSEAVAPTAVPTSEAPAPTTAPTSPPAPTATIVPSPTRPQGPSPTPTRTSAPSAPLDGFTPIPIVR
jgi:hypothetical protein